MKLEIFILLVATYSIATADRNCNVNEAPKSWATVSAKYVTHSAWQPQRYLNVSSFCVVTDIFAHTLNYWSHVNLVDATVTVQQDYANASDIASSQANCGFDSANVTWCQSHCQNKDLESIIIEKSIKFGPTPYDIAAKIYEQLNYPYDVTIAGLYIDQNAQIATINYDYYDDFHFCSVYLKISKQDQIPYVLLFTAQKVL